MRTLRAAEAAIAAETEYPLEIGQREEWREWFEAAFRDAARHKNSSLPGSGQELAIAAWPPVEAASEPVASHLFQLEAAGIVEAPSLPQFFASLTSDLWQDLFGAMSRTMVLELAAAQTVALPQGQGGRGHYDLLVECLSDPEFAISILETHDGLCELISTMCRQWSAACSEMLCRIRSDWSHICAWYFPATHARLVSIETSRGDKHRHGRSVALLRFESGARLVYKPRSMQVETNFTHFIEWFNRTAGEEILATAEALDRGDHGWCGFVENCAVEDRPALERYHFRLGALIAVSRILGLTDLHYQNLVANGEWPVIIDLETLFHPLTTDLYPQSGPTLADEKLAKLADESVRASGLLPIREPLAAEGRTLNIAGMSDVDALGATVEVSAWEGAGTDKMRIVEACLAVEGGSNLPLIGEARVAPEPFRETIIAGFKRAYDVLFRQREALLSPHGPLAHFAQAPIRVVLRPTQHYLDILANCSHPDLLADPGEKAAWLSRALPADGRRRQIAPLAASEFAALWRNDVPYFETVAASCDLLGCDGQSYPNILPRCGLDVVADIVRGLGPTDFDRQCHLISAALTTSKTVQTDAKRTARTRARRDPGEAGERIARLAAQEICNAAIQAEGSAAWFTLCEGANGSLVSTPAALDLYSGLPGIALFLSLVGDVLNDAAHARALGRAATVSTIAAIGQGVHETLPLGAQAGLGGLAFALKALEGIHRDLPVDKAHAAVLAAMRTFNANQAPLELMTGLAGAVAALADDDGARELVAGFLTFLCERIESSENGAQCDPVFDSPGMAHGVAGLNLALSVDLCRLPGALRHRVIAARQRLSLLRQDPGSCCGSDSVELSWCGGLAGQVITNTHRSRDNPTEILRSALEKDAFGDDSLCHGAMGALVALRECDSGQELARQLLGRVGECGPRCGTIGSVRSPALMDGLAGIGLAALEFGCAAPVPCVLTLRSHHERMRST